MTNKKSILVDLGLGLFFGLIALGAYLWTLSPSVYPGASTNVILSAAGIIPRFAPAYPLWYGLCDLLAKLVPDSAFMTALNGLTAACAAASVWAFYSVVKTVMWLTLKVESENYAQSLFASRLAGCVAAFTLTFTLPYWVMANRCHYGAFHVLLLLLTVRLFIASVDFGSNKLGYIFAVLYGVGCVEYGTFLVFSPIIAVAFFWAAHHDERLTNAVIIKMLGCLLIGLLAFLPFAWVFSQSYGAELRGIDSFGQSLNVMIGDSWKLLARSLPRQGWIVVLVTTSFPWLVSIGMGRRTLNNLEDRSVTALHVLLAAIVVAVLINSPVSPWAVSGRGRVLMMPYVLTAWTTGYLAAFFLLLPTPCWAFPDLESKPTARRVISTILAALIVGMSVSLPFLNARQADARSVAGMTRVAEILLSQLKGQKWILSDGTLDAQLMFLAQRNRTDVKFLSVASQGYGPLKRFSREQLNDAELESKAEISYDLLVQSWMNRGEEAINELAVMYPHYAWAQAGYLPVPQVLFFAGAASVENVDLDALKAEHIAAWDELIEIFEVGIEQEGFEALMRRLQRHTGLIANELGVLLEDAGKLDDAYDVYRKAREIDPENISALVNARSLIERDYDARDRDDVMQEYKSLMLRLRSRPVHILSVIQRFGTVRDSKAMASMGRLLALAGPNAMATSQLEKALSLADTDNEQEDLRLKLAAVYLAQDRTEDALSFLRVVVQNDPGNVRAFLGLSRVCAKLGRFELARKYLTKASGLGITHEEHILQKAFLLMMENRLGDAEVLLRDLLRENKRLLPAWQILVEIQIAKRDAKGLQQSIYVLEGIEKRDSFLHAYSSGHLAMMSDDVEGVQRHFENALSIEPGNIALLQMTVRLFSHQGQMDLAEDRARRLLQLDPDNFQGNLVLSNIQILRGELDLAENALRRLLILRPHVEVMNSLAVLLKQKGDLGEAQKLAEDALAMEPNFPALWDTLGEVLLQAEKTDEATVAFQRALSIVPNYPAAILHLASLWIDEGNTDKATDLLEKLTDIMYDLRPEHRKELRALRVRVGLE